MPMRRLDQLSDQATGRRMSLMWMPHIGAEKVAEATGRPLCSARSPMQPPMECARRCQGRGRSSTRAASSMARTSR